MRLALVACLLLALLAAPARAASVALVMAVDVSESVSAERYALQHEGIARAFEAPQLIEAIAAAPGGIEALVMEWSDPDKIVVTVGWTLSADRGARRSGQEGDHDQRVGDPQRGALARRLLPRQRHRRAVRFRDRGENL